MPNAFQRASALGSTLGVLLTTNAASAADAVPAAKDDLTPPRFQVDGGFAFGFGFGVGAYALLDLGASYRPIPILLTGVAFEFAPAPSATHDSCADQGFCPPRFASIGPRVEMQPFAPGYVALWLGAELDALFLRPMHPDQNEYPVKSFVMATRFDLGVEGRPNPDFGIGLYIADKVSFVSLYEAPYWDSSDLSMISLGIRFAGRF